MYGSHTKQTFGRGWAINRILDRLPVSIEDALFFVLAGEGRDRECLLKRGVPDYNIISGDRDAKAIMCVREAGGIAIEGDAAEILSCWRAHTPFHALMLDFNCGLDEAIRPVAIALRYPSVAPSAAIYINLQRGRDDFGQVSGKRQLKELAKHEDAMVIDMRTGLLVPANSLPIAAPNRGQAFFYTYLLDPRCGWQRIMNVLPPLTQIVALANRQSARPYRQKDGGVLMDGLVFSKVVGFEDEPVSECGETPGWMRSMRRKISAARAVRTARRRARGSLERGPKR